MSRCLFQFFRPSREKARSQKKAFTIRFPFLSLCAFFQLFPFSCYVALYGVN
nr:MAG TPA: hypothetical protein [Caudoviricetes sp.]